MKIGILTFHWATNYGAILQAFALQTYLKNLGHDVYIINYRPKQYKKTLSNCFSKSQIWLLLYYLKQSFQGKRTLLSAVKLFFVGHIKEHIKEKKLDVFRKKYLSETLPYESSDELQGNPPVFDVYICGSDQIWNTSFTIMGEGKPTSAYFLDFGDKNVKRIAYAVSFGCEDYSESASKIARKYIHGFYAISVRENSGINIVSKLGFKNPVKLPDPTLLLRRDDYCFANSGQTSAHGKAFVYILREEDNEIRDIKSWLKKIFEIDLERNFLNPCSVEEWVNGIKNASIVLTNSFHGMVFSLIFHVPFIIVQAEGVAAGMNDRFITLLSYLNLAHRIVNNCDTYELNRLVDEKINWQKVDNQIAEFSNESAKFFDQVLN